jgi:hypothetical protein
MKMVAKSRRVNGVVCVVCLCTALNCFTPVNAKFNHNSLANQKSRQQTDDTGDQYPCAIPQCATPCPEGQYLAEDEHGCETCDCYDPCQGVDCQAGKCSWILNEGTRPETFCADCPGGQVWNRCGSGSCVATCSNTSPSCPRNCYAGCYCPLSRPVWHHETCLTVDQCKDQCDGDQVWTDEGRDVTPTCADPDLEPIHTADIGRCACPSEKPLWDEKSQQCLTRDECHQQDTLALRRSLDGIDASMAESD